MASHSRRGVPRPGPWFSPPRQVGSLTAVGKLTILTITDENRIQKLTIELQNGRLAMLGVLGMLMGDVVAPGTMGLPTADGIGLF